jgi:hypothetical protein
MSRIPNTGHYVNSVPVWLNLSNLSYTLGWAVPCVGRALYSPAARKVPWDIQPPASLQRPHPRNILFCLQTDLKLNLACFLMKNFGFFAVNFAN